MHPVTDYISNPFFGSVTFAVTEPIIASESVEIEDTSSPFVDAPRKESPKNPWLDTAKSVVSFIGSVFKTIQKKISVLTSKAEVEKPVNKNPMPQMYFCPEELTQNQTFITSFFEQEAHDRDVRRIKKFYSVIVT
jgi:hypothetical protein